MNWDDVQRWREALANCALEGNVTAQTILALEDTDPERFLLEIERLEATG